MLKKILGLVLLSVATFSFAADDTDTKGDDKEKEERGFFLAAADDKEDKKEKNNLLTYSKRGSSPLFLYIYKNIFK